MKTFYVKLFEDRTQNKGCIDVVTIPALTIVFIAQ